jgi:hypothetical protein
MGLVVEELVVRLDLMLLLWLMMMMILRVMVHVLRRREVPQRRAGVIRGVLEIVVAGFVVKSRIGGGALGDSAGFPDRFLDGFQLSFQFVDVDAIVS